MELNNTLPETYCLGSALKEKNPNLNRTIPIYNISKEFIKKEYFENNKSQQEIADKLGISQWVISHRMRKYNLKAKERTWKIGKKKYIVNDNFFDEVNTSNAWVLGWLASDGFVIENNNSSCFGLKISEKDVEILHIIKTVLQFDGPILSSNTYLKKTVQWYKENEQWWKPLVKG